MENPAKRQRTWRWNSKASGNSGLDHESHAFHPKVVGKVEENGGTPQGPTLEMILEAELGVELDFPSRNGPKPNPPLPKPTPMIDLPLHKRGILPAVANTVTAVIPSVLDVVIDSGTNVVAHETIPAVQGVPAVVSVPNVGPVTIPPAAAAVPSPPPQNAPAVPIAPAVPPAPANPPSQPAQTPPPAPDSPPSTPAKELEGPPANPPANPPASPPASPPANPPAQPPANPPVIPPAVPPANPVANPPAVAPANPQPIPQPNSPPGAASNTNSISIQIPGATSQQVLSSPPATPLPSGSAATASTMFTSSGTGSYFSPNAATASSGTTTSPGPGQTTVAGKFPAASAANNTTSAPTTLSTATRSAGLLSGSSNFNGTQSMTSTGSSSLTESGTATLFPFGHLTSSSLSGLNTGTSITTDGSSIATSSGLATASSSLSSSGSSTTGFIASGSGAPTGNGANGGSPSDPGATSTSTAGAGNGSGSNTPPTPTLVGGVVGGVAGIAVILLLLLFLLRWRRKSQNRPLMIGEPELIPPSTARSAPMTERSSNVPIAFAGLAPGFFGKLRPRSGQTTATTDTAPSERGFQNFGGRKLESVLTSGGDGWGGPGPSSGPRSKDIMSGSSFYRDSQGTYGGRGSEPSSVYGGPSGPAPIPVEPLPGRGNDHRTDSALSKEFAVMRPSPARTPVTSHGGFSQHRMTTPPPRGTPSPSRSARPIADAVGRSRPSLDGSRGSRFTESGI
ncbi:hypothetical protein MMC09_001836 [Bachmanniomyces sp. S44760]|nr:hypothetical protein [Bachmanniomyces sp. S44760]